MRTTLSLRMPILVAVAFATVTLVIAAAVSLAWRYVLDAPLMIYAGFLIAGGAVPYRDFFDMNMPGSYLVMLAAGVLFGWDDLGFRVLDLLLLAGIAVSTFMWMRRCGRLAAVCASMAFPLWYLGNGPAMSLQREYIALLPLSGVLAIVTARSGLCSLWRFFLAGFLTGTTMLVKPHYCVLCLPAIIIPILDLPTTADRRRLGLVVLAGLVVPLVAGVGYLGATKSLGPFLDIAINYWPLYAGMTGEHEPIEGLERLLYLARSTWDGMTTFYFPGAVVGIALVGGEDRRFAAMVAGLLIAASAYPAFSGQFWTYHWIPFRYVALCATFMALRGVAAATWRVNSVARIAIPVFVLVWLSLFNANQLRSGGAKRLPSDGIPDEINQFLRARMQPGDLVQPLDWTGGAVHGMLMARAPLATSFMYDFHFYHHIDRPYITRLRRRFMDELSASAPRFVIQILEEKPWPRGANTTHQFPELQGFLDEHYATAYQRRPAYRILQRREQSFATD